MRRLEIQIIDGIQYKRCPKCGRMLPFEDYSISSNRNDPNITFDIAFIRVNSIKGVRVVFFPITMKAHFNT